MKIGIVGTGLVGATAAYALVMSGIGREIALVDKDTVRAQAEADDILHAVPFAHPMRISAGEYPSLAGSSIGIIPAAVEKKPKETRLPPLGSNAQDFQQRGPGGLTQRPEA